MIVVVRVVGAVFFVWCFFVVVVLVLFVCVCFDVDLLCNCVVVVCLVLGLVSALVCLL